MSKNKTVSFRVDESSFESLREIADRRDLSLSAVFRDYVDTLVANDGQVRVVPEGVEEGDDAFPPTVEVPKSFVREHERLELEAKHLREQLEEHKRYITRLRDSIEDEDVDDVVHLDDLDDERESYEFEADDAYRLG